MLHLVLKLEQQQKKHDLTARSTTGRTFTMDVTATTTIGQATSQFEEVLSVPAGEHVLVYGGRKLDESQQVEQAGLPGSATVHLILKPPDCSVLQGAAAAAAPTSGEVD